MPKCPHCHSRFAELLDECPECRGCGDRPSDVFADDNQSAEPVSPYVAVARFHNVAEAGYFHCELEGRLDCDVRLATQNDFDAANATWRNHYILSVPAAEAETATLLLKQLVAETADTDVAHPDPGRVATSLDETSDPVFSEPRIHWAPIVLTLTAGTFVIWAAKQAHRNAARPAGGRVNEVNAWEQLGNIRSPWIQHLDDGPGRRELMIDPAGRTAILREDHDGDGIFERSAHLLLAPTGHD
ncbi:MAG: hypothetical protein KF861_15990 [Planctomycetaceae bacterium]|nr:hypothetical protein [Planctomycetaceae bacterium]